MYKSMQLLRNRWRSSWLSFAQQCISIKVDQNVFFFLVFVGGRCRYSLLRRYIIHDSRHHPLVQKRAVLPVGKPLQSWFFNRSTNARLKGPSFSLGFLPGTKGRLIIPTGAKEVSRPGHVGRPFSPGWYYQPGLNIFFSIFFYFQLMIHFGFRIGCRIRILRC